MEENIQCLCSISGFRLEVNENRALMGYYAARSGNFLPTFRDNLSAPFRDNLSAPVNKINTNQVYTYILYVLVYLKHNGDALP
jgi:hypothetical protein